MHHLVPKLHLGGNSTAKDEKVPKDSSSVRARDDEKSKLAAWEADKRPLEYDQILVDPRDKVVGHSSKVLRRDDFELLKTLGTGALSLII